MDSENELQKIRIGAVEQLGALPRVLEGAPGAGSACLLPPTRPTGGRSATKPSLDAHTRGFRPWP